MSYQFKVSMDPLDHSVILSSVFIFLSNSSRPPYLTERSTLGHNDVEFPLPRSLFEEGLHCSGEANGHDHLVRVDVLQGLGRNVLRSPFCNNSQFYKENMKLS